VCDILRKEYEIKAGLCQNIVAREIGCLAGNK
jgi:hypothetical protein